jgi:hypothetical protein
MMTTNLILLVGSNPLPNYLSACALRPGRVVLVYSAETTAAKDRLKAQLSNVLGGDANLDDSFIEDPTCATAVERVIDGILQGKKSGEVWLNYTGGTKVMAAHARMAFQKHNGLPKHASYLNEGGSALQPQLRFDDGTAKALAEYADVPLKLTTVLGLHGISHTPRAPKEPAPTAMDADAILRAVLKDVPLASSLYCERERLESREYNNPQNAVAAPFRAERYKLQLSQDVFPTETQMASLPNRKERESWFKQWYSFIGGEWLEEWLGETIRRLDLKPTPEEIVVGVNAQRGDKKANLEVDIAVVRAHRSYFISCTTDTTKAICKSKLFEIAVRSRQLGGELARAALVCLADDTIVGSLQQDIDDMWGASNTTRVFGLSDLKTWSGFDGDEANLTTLKAWLES